MKAVPDALAARVPPGQQLTTKWPVLTYGRTPRFDPRRWTFRCFGLVEREVSWTWEEFLRLPRVTVTSDIHCVTRWSRLDNEWEGVHVRTIVEACRPRPEAKFVLQHADPDYTTNTAIEDLVDDDVLLALKHNGRDLAAGQQRGAAARRERHREDGASQPAQRSRSLRAASARICCIARVSWSA